MKKWKLPVTHGRTIHHEVEDTKWILQAVFVSLGSRERQSQVAVLERRGRQCLHQEIFSGGSGGRVSREWDLDGVVLREGSNP